MNAYIVINPNKLSLDQITKLVYGKAITLNTSDVLEIETEKSIGIEFSRSIKEFLHTKALTSQGKFIFIRNAEKLTKEAQNALLKILEEPPPETIIVLQTINQYLLLPTINSRCVHLHVSDNTPALKMPDILTQLTSPSMGDRYLLIDTLPENRAEAETLLLEMTMYFRSRVKKALNATDFFNMKLCLYGLKLLKNNTHIKLTLDTVIARIKLV